VLTLSKYEHPDLGSFNDTEVHHRILLDYHAGLIVKSKKKEKVLELLESYTTRLADDYSTSAAQEEIKKFH